MAAANPLITNEDIETAVGAMGRFIVAAPRLLAWLVLYAILAFSTSSLAGGVILAVVGGIWALLYALPVTRNGARWAWLHVGPAADAYRLRVAWKPGSKPDLQARRKGAAMVRKLAASARDEAQSVKHTNPNGSTRWTDPRGVSLEVVPLGVRLVTTPTRHHTSEGLAKVQDRLASRLGVSAPERLVATVLDQKHTAFDWEYRDPYKGTRMGVAVDDPNRSREAA